MASHINQLNMAATYRYFISLISWALQYPFEHRSDINFSVLNDLEIWRASSELLINSLT